MRTILLLSFLVSSCASTDTEKLMEAGLYSRAIDALDAELKKAPHDEEVMIKLGKARAGYLGNKLIKARMQRLSKDKYGALASLQDAFVKQRQWGVKLDSAVSNSASTEVEKGWEFIYGKAHSLVDAGKPLAAAHLLVQNSLVIDNVKSRGAKANLFDKIVTSGKKKCKSMGAEAPMAQPGYASVVGGFCSVFGAPSPKVDKSKLPGYKSISVSESLSTGGYDKTSIRSMSKAFADRILRDSLWFNPSSKATLKSSLKLNISYKKRSKVRTNRIQYFVKKPFEAHELVEKPSQSVKLVNKSKSIRYQDCTQKGCSNKTASISLQVPVIKNKNQKVKQKVTRYRDIPKSFSYESEVMSESVSAYWDMSFVDASLGKYAHQTEKTNESEAHSSRFSEQNISPKKHQFLNKADVARQSLTEFGHRIDAGVLKAWVKKFCVPGTDKREQVSLCSRATPKSDKARRFVDGPFVSWFGVNSEEYNFITSKGFKL